jgi:HAD superfamily hydrolase (TIGR01484 family)
MVPIVLATDLDGTFLGGDAAQRAALYDWLATRREHVTVIYVTGRGLGFVRQLALELPEAARPDHAVANVGTTAATGPDLVPLEPVEQWLAARWRDDAVQRIHEVLREHDHLKPQPVVEGRRVSYFFTDPVRAQDAKREIEALGFDVLMSDNQYFDVLPPGVCKGPTLLRMLDALSIPREHVLVAGDTLNDLSLFETGLLGVAVSNREPELDQAVRHMPHVIKSSEPGAAGVLQALTEFEARRRA